jgi:tetratricopeptide (TPR) repeat protein
MTGRAAVVVGINYETGAESGGTRAGLTRLRFAEADAQAVAAELETAGYAVRVLLGAAATRSAIINAIVQQRRVAGADGLLILHFSGHGDVDPDDEQMAYLLPVDTNPDELPATAIPLNVLVQTYLGTVGAALTLLDCCHSGWALGWRGAGDRGEPFRRQAMEAFNLAAGRVVLTACPGDALARELAELRHGVFTYHLLAHWRGREDEVTAESLFAAIDQGLEGHGLSRPVMGGTHRGRLTLRDARTLAAAQARLAAAEVTRREQLYAALSGLDAAGWAALLAELGEDPAAYGGTRAAAARRLILKLAGEGLLGALEMAARRATDHAAAGAMQAARLIRQFQAARARKDWDAAIALGERIVGLDPASAGIYAPLAAAYYEQNLGWWRAGAYDRAIAAATRAIALDPHNAHYVQSRGISYHDAGDYARAIADATQAIALDPQNAQAYNQRGISYDAQGDYDRAVADHTRALELAPATADFYRDRGVAYHNQGAYDAANADITPAQPRDPPKAQNLYARGVSYQVLGAYAQAIADLSAAVAHDPTHPRPNWQRGVTYHNAGDYARALADYSAALARDPTQPAYYLERGKTYSRQGAYAPAIADFTAALARDANNASILRERGVAYHNQGALALALADYTRAATLDPRNGEYPYLRALSLLRQGDPAAARAELARAAALGYAPAQEALARSGEI